MKALLPLFAAAFVVAAPAPTIEKLDPALDALVAADVQIEKVGTGYGWAEGPVWCKDRFVFSDVPKNVAFAWKRGDAEPAVFLKPSGTDEPSDLQGSNGLAVDGKGNLLLCQHGARRVGQSLGDGKFKPLATTFEGKKFNSPNDLAIAADGSVYFTDPPYGLPKGQKAEQDFHGVYKLAADGKVTLVSKAVKWPNGIALSRDQKQVYLAVSDSANTRVTVCDLDGGNLRDVFVAQPLKKAGRPGGCDGLKLDAEGNIWTTGPGGVLILSPQGKHLGSILFHQPTANLAWGEDGKTLFVTSNHDVFVLRTKVKGAGF
jgi:gluconolactonase